MGSRAPTRSARWSTPTEAKTHHAAWDLPVIGGIIELIERLANTNYRRRAIKARKKLDRARLAREHAAAVALEAELLPLNRPLCPGGRRPASDVSGRIR